MTTASVTHNFIDATNAVADDVDENFTDLVNYLNSEVMLRDGSVPFTFQPTLPGDPSLPNDAANKAYVDAGDIRRLRLDPTDGSTDPLALAVGAAWTEGTDQPWVQAGSAVMNDPAFTTAGGLQTITFPSPFATGIASIVVSNGDDGNSHGGADWSDRIVSIRSNTLSGIVVNWTSQDGGGIHWPLNGGEVRCNWIAVGW